MFRGDRRFAPLQLSFNFVRMKARFLFNLLILWSMYTAPARAQSLNAYSDYRDHFFVFDNGTSRQLEHLPVQSFQVGHDVMAWVDNIGNLKAYYKGEPVTLEKAWLGEYAVTDNLVVFKNGTILRVFDKGVVHDLTFRAGEYVAGDRIVAFLDENYLMLKAYSDGRVEELENIALGEVKGFKVGENTIGFVTYNDRFRVYYDGRIADIDEYIPQSYACGKDAVAYVDASTGMFKGYIAGKNFKLSDFTPVSYQVADSLIAFVSSDGNFNVVTGKTIREVEPGVPDFYTATDRVVAYGRNGFFYAHVNGKSYQLETVIPSEYRIDGDRIAWLDNSKRIKWLRDGEIETVTYEGSKEFGVHGATVNFMDNAGLTRIYFNKKVY